MKPTTLIIAGAGMSAALGLPTSSHINDIIKSLLDYEHGDRPRRISDRLEELRANGIDFDAYAAEDFETTLSILFDGNGAKNIEEAYTEHDRAVNSYINNYKSLIRGTKTQTLKHHLMNLTQTYDIISLKSIIYSLKHHSQSFDIVNVLTAIQSSLSDGISIPTREIFPNEGQTRPIYYCDRKRLEGALNAYKLLIYKIVKHLLRNLRENDLSSYESFFYAVANKCLGSGFSNRATAWKRDNYLSDIGYLTYNWDPILPFLSMKVNQKINNQLLSRSSNGICKKIYMDFGVPFAGVKLSGEHTESPVYSFSEDAAFLINVFTKDSYYKPKYQDKKCKLLIKIIKQFVPHGLLNMRICPRCQNGIFIFPENIGDLSLNDIANLFSSDPIPSHYDLTFIANSQYKVVLKKYRMGLPDELDCASCGHPVYFDNSFMEIQSMIKNEKPATVSKIHFDYAEYFSRANHIVSIGYSFPKDDILNSVFLQNMKIRKDELGRECKLTFIDFDTHNSTNLWHTNPASIATSHKQSLADMVQRISNMFPVARFNFNGFPGILKRISCDQILDWN